MAGIFKTFWSDEKVADDGVAFDCDGKFDFKYEGKKYKCVFVMRHLGLHNIEYEELKTRLHKPHLNKKGELDCTTEQILKMAVRLFVDTVLVEWQNFEEERPGLRKKAIEEHGVPIIPYSRETAIELFTRMPEFLELLQDLAREPSMFQLPTEKKQKQLGNEFPPTIVGS